MVGSSGISFSGLASGLDTTAIINQLVALERVPILQLEARREEERDRLDLVGQLGDLVKTLQTKAQALSTPADFYSYTASVSDESVASVTASSEALPGSHTLEVSQLAATDRWAFDGVSSADQNLTSTSGQQVDFTVGTTAYSIVVDPASSSLEDIAAQINQVAEADVVASVVNSGTDLNPNHQLVLASRSSGEDGRLTGLSSNVDGLTIDYQAPDVDGNAQSSNNVTVGNDAIALVDGLSVRRSTNDFSGVVEGLSIDALSTTPAGQPITISVDPDQESIRANLDEFVTAYNAVIDFIDVQSTFTPNDDPEDDGGTVGGLFGDTLLTSVKAAFRRALFDVDLEDVQQDTEGYSTLSLVGIEQDQDGRLSIDSTTFDAKFADDLEALMDLFADSDGFDNGGATPNTPGYYTDTTADSGLMAKLDREIDRMFGTLDGSTQAVPLQGIFDIRSDAINERIERFGESIASKERRLEDFEETLVLRFARLEELIGSLNAQGAALGNALGGA